KGGAGAAAASEQQPRREPGRGSSSSTSWGRVPTAEGSRTPRQSSQTLAEGAGKEPGSQAQGKERYQLSMDVSGFSPAELMVRVDGRKLTVTGKREKKTESEAGVRSQEYREIRRETLLPEDVNVQAVLCSLSQDGQLCIEAPRLALPAAQGRDIPISVCQGQVCGWRGSEKGENCCAPALGERHF
uniref:SHSP domain-containing protein n=1 Tax=Gopherus evgoodei TaxID=1825980 RepID=A0A8C4YKD9_9SAUR